MTMSVDGLVSGMDTTAIINQLLQAEANPQVLLKQKLSAAQTEASGYRTVNTTFAAVRAAAEALTLTTLAAARKASSSAPSVTASAGTTAAEGASVTFSVTQLAQTQQQATTPTWSSATALWSDKDASRRLEFQKADGTVADEVVIPAGATLNDVAKLINDSDAGVRATVVQPVKGTFQLLVGSVGSGTDGSRSVVAYDAADAEISSPFFETKPAQDAVIDLGGGLTASSSTNTFADLLTGVSLTVSEVTTSDVTVSVKQDADSIATKVQTLVDAVNAALSTVKTYTNNDKGSTAALKGDYNLTSLSGRLLQAVSGAVGDDGSPVKVGLQLAKDGKSIVFDKAKFTTALKETPELAQRMISGQVASSGEDGIAGNTDDLTAVTGIAGRLFDVAKAASDSTTGSIVALAKGKDSIATDLTTRIEAWDLRLVKRKEMLTRQFTAMETALSSLKNQSTWLAGQINGLPQWS